MSQKTDYDQICVALDVVLRQHRPSVFWEEPEEGEVPDDTDQGCSGCTWIGPEGEDAFRAHAVEMLAYALTRVPTPAVPEIERKHRDALADTGNAYHAFHGWVLNCLWCDFEAVGKTKTEALRGMQRHYDAVLPEGAEIRG